MSKKSLRIRTDNYPQLYAPHTSSRRHADGDHRWKDVYARYEAAAGCGWFAAVLRGFAEMCGCTAEGHGWRQGYWAPIYIGYLSNLGL